MRTSSRLTWRTFRLAVVGLCLACGHAAVAKGGPVSKGRTAANVNTYKGSAQPAGKGGSSPSRRGNWTGVGSSSIATFTNGKGGGGSGGVATYTNSSVKGARTVAFTGRTGAPSAASRGSTLASASRPPTTAGSGRKPAIVVSTDREQAVDQTRRVDLSVNLQASLKADAAPTAVAASDSATPSRDPRVAAALKPVASGPGLRRDAFGVRRTAFATVPPR